MNEIKTISFPFQPDYFREYAGTSRKCPDLICVITPIDFFWNFAIKFEKNGKIEIFENSIEHSKIWDSLSSVNFPFATAIWRCCPFYPNQKESIYGPNWYQNEFKIPQEDKENST